MARPTTTDHRSDAASWQRHAEGLALFVVGAAPILSVLQAIATLRGDPTIIEVPVEAARTLAVSGTNLPLDSALVEVLPTTTRAWPLAADLAGLV